MKNFNWEKFMDKDNKIAVHCKTEEEAIDFCRQMDGHGLKWCDSVSYIEENNWEKYKKETCYLNDGTFTNMFSCEDCADKLLEWSDYIKKIFN